MSTPTDSDELTKARALLEEFRATFDEHIRRNEELLREIAKQTAVVGDTLQCTFRPVLSRERSSRRAKVMPVRPAAAATEALGVAGI
jgi:hypothetical protein